jgi:hypothetical protein
VGCTDFTIAQFDGAGGVDVATSIHTGTLMTGLFGPIPCRCRTVSKIQMGVGVGGFGAGFECKYVFVGYIDDGLCFQCTHFGACE